MGAGAGASHDRLLARDRRFVLSFA